MRTILSTSYGDIVVDSETFFGDLAAAFRVINAVRLSEGRPTMTHYGWRKTKHAKAYLQFLEKRLGFPPVIPGRSGGGDSSTKAHAFVILRAASDLSDILAFELYSAVMEQLHGGGVG